MPVKLQSPCLQFMLFVFKKRFFKKGNFFCSSFCYLPRAVVVAGVVVVVEAVGVVVDRNCW